MVLQLFFLTICFASFLIRTISLSPISTEEGSRLQDLPHLTSTPALIPRSYRVHHYLSTYSSILLVRILPFYLAVFQFDIAS
jgi:hypothetical protein